MNENISPAKTLIAFSFDHYDRQKKIYAYSVIFFGDSPASALQRAFCGDNVSSIDHNGVTYQLWEKDSLVLAFKMNAITLLAESTARYELENGNSLLERILSEMLGEMVRLREENQRNIVQ